MDRLLTPQEIADFLGVKKTTVYQWTHQGYIPYLKLGKFIRFRLADILEWIKGKSSPGRKTRKIDIRRVNA